MAMPPEGIPYGRHSVMIVTTNEQCCSEWVKAKRIRCARVAFPLADLLGVLTAIGLSHRR